MSWVPCSTLSTHTTKCPLTTPNLSSNLLMILWFWVLGTYCTSWCQDNCLSLNVSKTKELIVDFRERWQRPYTPLMISGTPVERVSSFKYLGVNISENLTWTTHIQTQVNKARQRLYHLRQLRKFRVSPAILKTFYSGAIESVLSQCGMETAQVRNAIPCRELCAYLSASQGLLSPLCRTSTSNAAKAELLK